MRAVLAFGALAAMLLLAAVGAVAATGPVSWSAYQAAARQVQAAAAHAPYTLPAASALRAAAVRWPDGTVSPVQPQPLRAGLQQSPASPQGAMSRAVLARIGAAPSAPGPAVDATRITAVLRQVLRQPRFARVHRGRFGRLEAALLAQARRLLLGVRAGMGRLLRRVSSLGGLGLVLAGLGALVVAAWGAVGLARRGFEPGTHMGRTRSPVAPSPPSPEVWLAQGDASGAVRAAYRQLLEAARRQGVDVRPGWTATRLLVTTQLAQTWPGFADFARIHDRLCFGPADAVGPTRAEVEGWLREVARWRMVRPRHDGTGLPASSQSRS